MALVMARYNRPGASDELVFPGIAAHSTPEVWQMERDTLFAQEIALPRDFQFDRNTATVFDDMVSRSVPFYDEIQRMTAEIGEHSFYR